jgi:hypothetical protein
MAVFKFDANTVTPDAGTPAPVPAGLYFAKIIESSVDPLKSGNGEGLKLVWQIVDGPHKGRRVFDHLSVRHTNPKTESIAQGRLSAICHAVGRPVINNTLDLHDIVARIKVSVTIDPTGQYEPKNEVKGIEPAGAQAPQAPQAPMFATGPAAAAPAAAAPAARSTPPWQKRAA